MTVARRRGTARRARTSSAHRIPHDHGLALPSYELGLSGASRAIAPSDCWVCLALSQASACRRCWSAAPTSTTAGAARTWTGRPSRSVRATATTRRAPYGARRRSHRRRCDPRPYALSRSRSCSHALTLALALSGGAAAADAAARRPQVPRLRLREHGGGRQLPDVRRRLPDAHPLLDRRVLERADARGTAGRPGCLLSADALAGESRSAVLEQVP